MANSVLKLGDAGVDENIIPYRYNSDKGVYTAFLPKHFRRLTVVPNLGKSRSCALYFLGNIRLSAGLYIVLFTRLYRVHVGGTGTKYSLCEIILFFACS